VCPPGGSFRGAVWRGYGEPVGSREAMRVDRTLRPDQDGIFAGPEPVVGAESGGEHCRHVRGSQRRRVAGPAPVDAGRSRQQAHHREGSGEFGPRGVLGKILRQAEGKVHRGSVSSEPKSSTSPLTVERPIHRYPAFRGNGFTGERFFGVGDRPKNIGRRLFRHRHRQFLIL